MEDNSFRHIWDIHHQDQQECSMVSILSMLNTMQQHKVATKLKLKLIIIKVSAFNTRLLLLLLCYNTLTCLNIISNSALSRLRLQSSLSQPLWLYLYRLQLHLHPLQLPPQVFNLTEL